MPQKIESHFCTNCGKSLASDDFFCPGCGQPVAPSAQAGESGASEWMSHPLMQIPVSTPVQVNETSLRQPEEVFCTHCDDALASDDAFCPGCGQPVEAPDGVPSLDDAGAQPNTSTDTKDAPGRIKVFRCPGCNVPLVPGDTSCLKCGKKFNMPVPKIVTATPPPATYQDPVLEGVQYHCPKCQAALETGTEQCPSCATQFVYPVPAYKMSLREAERLKQEEEQRKQEEITRRKAAERERKAQEARQKAEAVERMKAEAKVKSEEAAAQAAAEKAALKEQREEEAWLKARAISRNLAAAAEALRESNEADRERAETGQDSPGSADQAPADASSPPDVIPQFRTSTRKPLSEQAKTFLALAVLVVVGGGIAGIVNSSRSHSYTPTYTPPPAYVPPPPAYVAPLPTVSQPAQPLPPLPAPQPQANTSMDSRLIGRWQDTQGNGIYVFNPDGTGVFEAVSGADQSQAVTTLYTITHWDTHDGQIDITRQYPSQEVNELSEPYTMSDDGNVFTYGTGSDSSDFNGNTVHLDLSYRRL